MLKEIPAILSPELLKVLARDGPRGRDRSGRRQFPSGKHGKDAIVVRADGHSVPELLDAVLTLMPLDQYTEKPAALMEVVPGDDCKPTIWDKYRRLLDDHGENSENIEMMERFAFYERAKKAYAIVATGETAIYANILLKKGVVQ